MSTQQTRRPLHQQQQHAPITSTTSKASLPPPPSSPAPPLESSPPPSQAAPACVQWLQSCLHCRQYRREAERQPDQAGKVRCGCKAQRNNARVTPGTLPTLSSVPAEPTHTRCHPAHPLHHPPQSLTCLKWQTAQRPPPPHQAAWTAFPCRKNRDGGGGESGGFSSNEH